MVTGVTSQGFLLSTFNTITTAKDNLAKLHYRLATGEQESRLSDYGIDAFRLINFDEDIETRNSYLRSIELVDIVTKSYDTSLTKFDELTSALERAAEPANSFDQEFRENALLVAENLIREFQITLNIEAGGRFLYAGRNFDRPPAEDLNALPLYDAADLGVPDVIEVAPTVPSYTPVTSGVASSYLEIFSEADTDLQDRASADIAVTVDTQLPLTYNITASEPAFQNLFEGLLRLKSATEPTLTSDESAEFLLEARRLADTAKNEIRALAVENGFTIERLKSTKEFHESYINLTLNAKQNITLADKEQTAVELNKLNTQLQANYSVINTRTQLSLLNYLN